MKIANEALRVRRRVHKRPGAQAILISDLAGGTE